MIVSRNLQIKLNKYYKFCKKNYENFDTSKVYRFIPRRIKFLHKRYVTNFKFLVNYYKNCKQNKILPNPKIVKVRALRLKKIRVLYLNKIQSLFIVHKLRKIRRKLTKVMMRSRAWRKTEVNLNAFVFKRTSIWIPGRIKRHRKIEHTILKYKPRYRHNILRHFIDFDERSFLKKKVIRPLNVVRRLLIQTRTRTTELFSNFVTAFHKLKIHILVKQAVRNQFQRVKHLKEFSNKQYYRHKRLLLSNPKYLHKDVQLKLYKLYNKNYMQYKFNLTRFYTRYFYKLLKKYESQNPFQYKKFIKNQGAILKFFNQIPLFQTDGKKIKAKTKALKKKPHYLLGTLSQQLYNKEFRRHNFIKFNILPNRLKKPKVKVQRLKPVSLKKFKLSKKLRVFVNKQLIFQSINHKLQNSLNKFNILKSKLVKNFNFISCTKYNFFLFRESFKYYEQDSKFCYLKNLLLTSLSLYTGYTQINLNFNPLFKSFNKYLELKYSNLKQYSSFTLKKYKSQGLTSFMTQTIIKWNTFYKDMLQFFTYFEHQIFFKFLKRLYYYITLPFIDPVVYFLFISRLIFEVFKYIYLKKKGYFRKAFEFFNKLLYSLFKNLYFPLISGLKIIAKGRFGKTRKQIGRIQLGYLKLHTVSQVVSYSNNLLVTKRGSYGFHIWCSLLNKNLFSNSLQNTHFFKI